VSRLAAVAAGGAVGASLRYTFIALFPSPPGALPATILAENLLGAFLLGVAAAVLVQRFPRARTLQAFLTTGVIGSFTTFSTLSLDVLLLADAGRWLVAAGYAAASVLGGLVAAAAGLLLGRQLAAPRVRP
jgi:fluoride exporter